MFFSYDILVFLIIILALLYSYFDYKAKYWERRGVCGPKALPIIGNLFDNLLLAQNLLEVKRRKKYGKVYGVMQGLKPVLTVGDPELLKQILITDFRAFTNHGGTFTGLSVLEKILPELKDNEWKRVRSTVSPAFTTAKLNGMQPLIENCISKIFTYLDSLEKQHAEVDVKRMAMAYTLDVIAVCIFGVTTNASGNPNDVFVLNAYDLVHFKLWRALTMASLPAAIQVKYDLQLFPQRLLDYFVKILENIISQRKRSKAGKVDFVTLLLNAREETENAESEEDIMETVKNARKKLSDEEIMSECFIFFLAGFETSATFLNFTLYALAMNPQVQEKLFQEINQYFMDHETIDYNSLNALPYFDAVCNESMRLYSPLTCSDRTCGENYQLGDILIEKGVIINLPLYALHHDSELFPNPEEFIAERFLPENKHNIKPYSFIPFGLGPRICIGNRFAAFKSKLFLAELVRNFEIIKNKNTPERLEYTGKYIFLTSEEIFVDIRRRMK